jgi:hypothetical protein
METEHRALLHHFESQLDEAKFQFHGLAKKIRSKKVIPLERLLFSCKLFLILLSKIHFNEKRMVAKLFAPYETLFKHLRKSHHIKIIEEAFTAYDNGLNGKFQEYRQFINSDKKREYALLFDLVVSWPLSVWEELFLQVAKRTHSLTPLQVNTASHQIIIEELDGVEHATRQHLDATRVKEIYEGLLAIIEVERLRVSVGLNPVFTPSIHEEMDRLTSQLYQWYKNQLLLQHLTHYLHEKEQVFEPYPKLLKGIRNNQKAFIRKLGLDWEVLIKRMSGT